MMQPAINISQRAIYRYNFLQDPQFKLAVKVLRDLRDDIATVYPFSRLPNTWVIRCMVASCFDPRCDHQDWLNSVRSVLKTIEKYSCADERCEDLFFEVDGITPLFSNPKINKTPNFSINDAHQFAVLALAHLSKTQKKDGQLLLF